LALYAGQKVLKLRCERLHDLKRHGFGHLIQGKVGNFSVKPTRGSRVIEKPRRGMKVF
jgi:hypothetical protein